MSEQSQKPKKGDYIRARKVVNGDYRDIDVDEGVVVGEPRRGNDEYYDILSPYGASDDPPFRGHIDDAEVIPDKDLDDYQKRFREKTKQDLNID